MSKKDDVQNLYSVSKKLSAPVSILFYANITLSLFSIVFKEKVAVAYLTANVIAAISYICISTFDDLYCWYSAESSRRKCSIENAFGVDITNLTTDGYYNNDLNPSVIKYSLNAFESLYFSKNVARKMTIVEVVKATFTLIVFILACIELKDREVLLLIVQAIFSTQFLIGTASLLVYRMRLDNLYEDYYRQFVTAGIRNRNQIYVLLATTVEYEAIKAHYKVRLSSRAFSKLNAQHSVLWDGIFAKVNISKNLEKIKIEKL